MNKKERDLKSLIRARREMKRIEKKKLQKLNDKYKKKDFLDKLNREEKDYIHYLDLVSDEGNRRYKVRRRKRGVSNSLVKRVLGKDNE